ncbi:MAG: hypothetical protein JOZ87_23515 [Chloroflexi bacterium]|nr:hypothetical protein [Chloroflexota bacterium]
MTLKNAAATSSGAREMGPESSPDVRADLGLRERSQDALRDRSGGRRWEIGPNPIREPQPRPSSRRVGGVVQRSPELERAATPRSGSYGAQIVQRTPGSRVGSIVRLSR